MEKDDESCGCDGNYTTHYRMLDTRVGRWWSVDPVTRHELSPYNSMDNSPIGLTDPRGDCPWCVAYGVAVAINATIVFGANLVASKGDALTAIKKMDVTDITIMVIPAPAAWSFSAKLATVPLKAAASASVDITVENFIGEGDVQVVGLNKSPIIAGMDFTLNTLGGGIGEFVGAVSRETAKGGVQMAESIIEENAEAMVKKGVVEVIGEGEAAVAKIVDDIHIARTMDSELNMLANKASEAASQLGDEFSNAFLKKPVNIANTPSGLTTTQRAVGISTGTVVGPSKAAMRWAQNKDKEAAEFRSAIKGADTDKRKRRY